MDIDILISFMNTIMTAVAIGAGVFFMMNYLQRGEGISSSKQSAQLRRELKELRNRMVHEGVPSRNEIIALSEAIDQIKKEQTLISGDTKEVIVAELKKSILEEGANAVIEELTEKAKEQVKLQKKEELIESQFSLTIDRLKEELFSLSKRGNLNLSIGIVTTLTGLALLGMFVLGDKPATTTPGTEQFLIDFIPRISLVILIEIFAYFFLRLYKANLSEIKYFQNEITTMESKYLALKVAANLDDTSKLDLVIEKLANSERNFILDKGQSTVDLERAKIEQQESSDLLDKLTSLVGKASKNV